MTVDDGETARRRDETMFSSVENKKKLERKLEGSGGGFRGKSSKRGKSARKTGAFSLSSPKFPVFPGKAGTKTGCRVIDDVTRN